VDGLPAYPKAASFAARAQCVEITGADYEPSAENWEFPRSFSDIQPRRSPDSG
jgi:hypothetical protein